MPVAHARGVLGHTGDPMSSTARVVAICLLGLAAALLAVGAVSTTMLRHCIQVAPIAVVMVVLTLRPRWGAYGALPIFVIWIVIVVLIWFRELREAGLRTHERSGHEVRGRSSTRFPRAEGGTDPPEQPPLSLHGPLRRVLQIPG